MTWLGDGPYRVTVPLAVATAALAPAYVLRWHVGIYPTTVLEAAILLTLVAFTVESARSRTMPAWRSPLTLPALLLIAAGAISIVVAPSRVAALGVYRAYFLEPVLYGLVLATIVRRPGQAYAVLAGFWAGAAVLCVVNTVVVLGEVRAHTFDPSSEPAAAIYLTGNAVALLVVPLVAAAGAIALHETYGRARLIAAAFLVVAVPGSVLTFSRGGWLALLAVAMGLVLSHRLRWVLASAGVVVLALLALLPAIRTRVVVQLTGGRGNTVDVRLELWGDALDMLRGRPVFGAGLSGFQQRITPVYLTRHQPAPYPHNILLAFWSETGLLGLAAFVWLVVAVARSGLRAWTRGPAAWRALALGTLLALLAMLTHGMVDTPYFKNDLSLEFWTIATLAVVAGRAPAE